MAERPRTSLARWALSIFIGSVVPIDRYLKAKLSIEGRNPGCRRSQKKRRMLARRRNEIQG